MILVTGGYGCIGAELIKWLLQHTNETVVLGSRSVGEDRTQRVFHGISAEQLGRLSCVSLDVSDRTNVEQVFAEFQPTRVAHLGALQTPDCNANRDLGLQINLAGTQHLIEAAKQLTRPLERFVFASSIAVYGPRSSYPTPRVPFSAEPNPVNVYGVWKLASEQISKLYSEDTGVPTIALRPGVLFGPGRDLGLTSTPTKAMKCVALGVPYEIPFCNKQDYLYAPDVGAAFAHALLDPFEGYGVFTLPSHTVDMNDLVAQMREATSELGFGDHFQVTVGNAEVPFICDLEFDEFANTFPHAPHTELGTAIRQSLLVFRDQATRGWLTLADVT